MPSVLRAHFGVSISTPHAVKPCTCYGDANAVFYQCEIRSTEHAAGGYLSAQGRYAPTQRSAFVFSRCRLTAVPGQTNVYLGRPWRPYASVVFLNTEMGAHIVPAGWREWHPGDTKYLDTAFYAEYRSTGPGATPSARDPHTHQLTPAEAAKYEPMSFLAGPDHWKPE
ncbi:pectinesterase/polygalacturonase [Granulicella rosea]|uniref:Pectinesterase/polygalacturonase n=1 Tax=Granulicella rosea TaxID=474952 RepID=A0A239M0I2_9BACT|nr:pectinesterase family protein [Granulicella rosea]SNT36020.1 pectinesterase/polygalacturonase [Granulicella rosea]